MAQPETQSELGYVIERVKKLEEEALSPSKVFESIKETRQRVEALEKLQDEIHGATMKFLGGIEEENKKWLLKFVTLQKQVEKNAIFIDKLYETIGKSFESRHKAYGEMFTNLQKQIKILQSRK